MAVKTAEVAVTGAVAPTPQNPLGIGRKTISELMPVQEYMELDGRLVNARRQVYYDTIRLEAGANWTTAQKMRLFTIGREGEGRIANTGATFSKSDVDTNMLRGGEFESGTTGIVTGLEVMLVLPNRLATADAAGIVSNPAPNAKAANSYSATLLLWTLLNQTRLTFYRGETSQENGLLWQFPTRFGVSGMFGGDAEEGLCQNAVPGGTDLEYIKILEDGKDFSVLVEPLAPALMMTADAMIRILLITRRIGDLM